MGGMGAVYLVHDKGLDRDVALKLIRSDIAEDTDALERFKREIQLSSRVTHPNVLRVFDLGESDGIQFLTMQFVDGRDLSTILKKQGKLPIDRLLRVFRQTAEGLKAAHDQGVTHRDLKPQNIMLDASERVYVTDFGMAKSSEQSGMTQTGAVIGTPFYMSPEQVKGEPVGPQSDIFSLGVILYQMATGVVPFGGATPFEVMMHEGPEAAEAGPGAHPRASSLHPEADRPLPHGRPGASLPERPADPGGPGRREGSVGDFLPNAVAALDPPHGRSHCRRGRARGRGALALPEGPVPDASRPEDAVGAGRGLREPRRRRGFRRNTRAGLHDRARGRLLRQLLQPERGRQSRRPALARRDRPRPDARPPRRGSRRHQRRDLRIHRQERGRLRGLRPGDRRRHREDDRGGPGKGFRKGGRPRHGGAARRGGPPGARRFHARVHAARRCGDVHGRIAGGGARVRRSRRTCSGKETGTKPSAATRRRWTSIPTWAGPTPAWPRSRATAGSVRRPRRTTRRPWPGSTG